MSPSILALESPIAVADLPHEPQDGVVGKIPQLPYELTEEGRPTPDRVSQVGGHLPGQSQHHVRVLAQFVGEPYQGLLRGR